MYIIYKRPDNKAYKMFFKEFKMKNILKISSAFSNNYTHCKYNVSSRQLLKRLSTGVKSMNN